MLWEWPGDDREARPKRVALTYRDLAIRLASNTATPDEIAALDQFWLQRGQHWVHPGGGDLYDPDEWITANAAAEYTGLPAKAVRKWAERGHIRIGRLTDRTPVYNVGDINAYEVRRTQARIKRRHAEQAAYG